MKTQKRGYLFQKEMPRNVFRGGPCAWRYSDYLRTGSIYTLPDDHRLQRGPTIVRLPSGRELRASNAPTQRPKHGATAHQERRPKCSNCWRFCPGNQREWQCHRALVRRHRGDPKLGVIPACCRDLWAALAITCYISNGVPMKVGLYIGADMNWRAR